MTGYTRTELQSMDFWNLVHPSMREVARTQGAARLRGDRVPLHNEVKIVTKGGDTRIEQVILNLLRNALEAIPKRPGAVSEGGCFNTHRGLG